jgi:DNA-binding transcriptional ArsR family regulator
MLSGMRQVARSVEVVGRRETAATLLQPLRQEILETLAEPESASGIARRLGLPRQKVNYHLRALEKDGFVELVEERRRGNCTERVVRATARSYLISPEALGSLGSDPERIQDRLSAAYLVATAGQALRDLGDLQRRAEEAGKRLATLTLTSDVCFKSAEARNAFAEELATAFSGIAAKYHDESAPGGRRFRFFIGGYPAPADGRDSTRSGAGRGDRGTGRKGEKA